jgi:cobalt-zinc-cadmium efflux system outer membrane protein
MLLSVVLIVVVTALVGCAGPGRYYGRMYVDSEIESRTSHRLGPATSGCEACFPNGVDFQDGISEDEAIAVALWNNASFQELLAEPARLAGGVGGVRGGPASGEACAA